MTPTEPAPRQDALDWLFARLAGTGRPAVAPAPIEVDLDAETAPPEVRSADDLRSAAEWLSRERRRLQAYVRAQLGRLQEEQQAFVRQKHLNEQALILRAQEVSRQEAMLAERSRRAGDGRSLADALSQAQEARAREEAALQARRAELDARFAAADAAALAAEQRLAELDDLEERLAREAQGLQRRLDAARAILHG